MRSSRPPRACGFLAGFLLLVLVLSSHGQARLKAGEEKFSFGAVGPKDAVEHTFRFLNAGRETLQITNVTVTAPLVFTEATSQIPPGKEGRVTVSLGTPRVKGDYEGHVELAFKNQGVGNLEFTLTGKIIPPVEFVPLSAFFVATFRGEPKQAALEIINHEKEPLQITRIEHDSSRFITGLKVKEPGQRYTLTLMLKGDGAAGRQSETITLVTTSKSRPLIKLPAHTLIKERVYSFPDALDFGSIKLQDLKERPSLVNLLSQTLMVYQNAGTDFMLTAKTDLPFLRLILERSPLKERYEIKVDVILEKLVAGKAKGFIEIETNDAEFKRLLIPVNAVVEAN